MSSDNIDIVTLPKTCVRGFAIRTTNTQEQTSAGGIGWTWQRARQKPLICPAAVLFDYENNSGGLFSEIIGQECTGVEDLEANEALTVIPEGKYAKFTKQGALPDIVLEAWQAVWAAEREETITRSYTVDFERYPSGDSVELYIAIR